MIPNINFVLNNNLCTGCGICEDICPSHSIKIKKQDGRWSPAIDSTTCLNKKGCHKCYRVCPGLGINLKMMSDQLYAIGYTDKYIGHYYSLYTGYSTNEEIRYHGASGGMVTQFLIYLLEKKIIDGAVVTSFSMDDCITPISYIARSKEDLFKARSSKYCPVSLNGVGNEICQLDGRYVIVGLPCHIQGFRKREQIDKKFKEKIVGYFSIYCSSNRTFNAQSYLFNKYNVLKSDISYFSYRDNGCLGDMIIKKKNQKTVITVPYIHYYPRLRSFFKPRRCLTCIDHYGELADVCFGDIHVEPYINDKVGINSWIVRNEYFDKLLKQAQQEGYIIMNALEANILNQSQKEMLFSKKRKAKALINIDRFFGKKTVLYDIVFNEKITLKDYLSVFCINIQRFIGRHRFLWFLIDISNFKR